MTAWFDRDLRAVGRLTVRAAANGFAGLGQHWTDRTATLEFAERLGQVGVGVHLATELWPDNRPESDTKSTWSC